MKQTIIELFKKITKLIDVKSIITITILFLFSYCIIKQLPIPEELKNALGVVLGFFLGSKVYKEDKKPSDEAVG